jgi:hypothetical protein
MRRGGGEEDKASITDWWTDANKAALDPLNNAPIKMANTAYGKFEAKKKKSIERTYKKMTGKEKNDLMQKLAELDTEDANDDESVPPSPTPVQLTYNYNIYFIMH